MEQHFLELLGEVCPVPLLRTQAKMATLKDGDTLVVETDFARAVRNIMNWSQKCQYPFEITEMDRGIWQIKIRKSHAGGGKAS